LGVPLTASNLVDLCDTADVEIPGFNPAHGNANAGPQQIGRIMGKVLKGSEELNLEQYRLKKGEERGLNQAQRIQTFSKYTFERMTRWVSDQGEQVASVPADEPNNQMNQINPNI
jgi:hypothetical protein